ncbi:Inner membrane protein yhjD [Citrobacter koseri]|nr:Inner membrane protein yhjD [Citrobacter koseri]
MTQEKDVKRPIQELDHAPVPKVETHDRDEPETNNKATQALKTVSTTAARIQRQPVIAHLIRAAERFNDRLGNQFGAAITYFSFLSMIPVLMVSFAAAGFILASHPTLLEDIFNKILMNVSDPTLASTLKSTINTAVQQRTTVGLVGLGIALYSGINWMGNLREAIRAPVAGCMGAHPAGSGKNLDKIPARFCLADWAVGCANYHAVHYLDCRFCAADDYLRAVSRQH